jgi:hypothetical protein
LLEIRIRELLLFLIQFCSDSETPFADSPLGGPDGPPVGLGLVGFWLFLILNADGPLGFCGQSAGDSLLSAVCHRFAFCLSLFCSSFVSVIGLCLSVSCRLCVVRSQQLQAVVSKLGGARGNQ